MELNLNKRQKFILVIIVSIAIGFGVTGLLYYMTMEKPIKRYNFYGNELEFRDDLRNAVNISVYPDKDSILNKVWDPDIYNIHIVYVPTPESSAENSMLALNAFEIRYKLGIAYNQFDWINEFTGIELESFEDISYTNDTLVIALVRPSLADKTAVELDGNVIYIKGETGKDLDYATIKFLMAALNITI